MTSPRDLRDPHLAAIVEQIPDDLFGASRRKPRERGALAWMRRWRRSPR